MGVMDTEGKKYLSNNEIFADAFNFLLYDGEKVIKADALRELEAYFLKSAMKLDLELEEEPGGIDMCKALEKKETRDKITGMIVGMRVMGASDYDIISKITETFNVTKEYVIALLAPQKVYPKGTP